MTEACCSYMIMTPGFRTAESCFSGSAVKAALRVFSIWSKLHSTFFPYRPIDSSDIALSSLQVYDSSEVTDTNLGRRNFRS